MRSPVLLAVLLIGAASVRAAEPTGQDAALAEVFARPALVGMQLSVRRAVTDGKVPSAILACVDALPPNSFNAVYDAALKENLSAEEAADTSTFFSSPVGRKYAKYGVLQIYAAVNVALPESLPEFSQAEYKELEAFSATEAGDKLMVKKVLEGDDVRQMVGARARELLRSCGDK